MSKEERKCLYCYRPLNEGDADFHVKCSQRLFGTKSAPEVDFEKNEIQKLGLLVLNKNASVTGVQPKLSVDLEAVNGRGKRFTIVGLWGNYILKPPFDKYKQMPEIEDLTMHLADFMKIKTAEHSLIRLKSGELAYITKRFDRKGKHKLALEDMAQLTGTLTERKYRSSVEKVGKAIQKYSTYSGNDLLRLFEITVFSFITGNADMHLKNFSLLSTEAGEIVLSPAYDLLATKLLIPEDKEEMALTLNGKRSNLRKSDFDRFARQLNINEIVVGNTYTKLRKTIPLMLNFINMSFISAELQETYKTLIAERTGRLFN